MAKSCLKTKHTDLAFMDRVLGEWIPRQTLSDTEGQCLMKGGTIWRSGDVTAKSSNTSRVKIIIFVQKFAVNRCQRSRFIALPEEINNHSDTSC